jgi:hypothetical protein
MKCESRVCHEAVVAGLTDVSVSSKKQAKHKTSLDKGILQELVELSNEPMGSSEYHGPVPF